MSATVSHISQQSQILAEQADLIAVIEQHLAELGEDGRAMSVKDFAARAGIHQATISGILSGNRRASTMSRETVQRLAAALRMPVLQFYALAGHIKPDDLIYSASLPDTLASLYRVMRADKAFAGRCPDSATWASWPDSARLAVAMLYEQMSQRRLLQYAQV